MERQSPIAELFARSWDVLRRNPAVIAPAIFIGLIVGMLKGMFLAQSEMALHVLQQQPNSKIAVAAAQIGMVVVLGILSVTAPLLTQAWTAGVASIAWQRGRTTLDDASETMRRNIVPIIVAFPIIATSALILGFATFGVGSLVVFALSLYVFPAIAVARRNALVAIRESFGLAFRRKGTTAALIGIVLAAAGVGWIVTLPFKGFPIANSVVMEMLVEVTQSYAAVAAVGVYLAYVNEANVTPPS